MSDTPLSGTTLEINSEIFEQQLLALAKENELKQSEAITQTDTNEKVDSTEGNVEDMLKDLLGALKREKTGENPMRLAQSGPQSAAPLQSAGSCGYATKLEPVVAPSGPGDADLTKLLKSLGDALEKPKERQVLAQPVQADQENSTPSQNAADCIDSTSVKPSIASSGPGDADLVKLLGALGNALQKPEEQKALAQMVVPSTSVAVDDDTFQKQLQALAVGNCDLSCSDMPDSTMVQDKSAENVDDKLEEHITSKSAASIAAIVIEIREKHLASWPPLLSRSVCHVASGPEDFRVLTFNLLADGKQGEEQWECTPPEALVWEQRKWRLLEEMLVYHPSVLLLQEVDAMHFAEFFQPELEKLGFLGQFQCKPGGKPDGVAVFWCKDLVRLKTSEVIEFTSSPEVALAVLLEQKQGREFLVASTHLKAGKDAASESTRASQASQLLTALQSMVDTSSVPIVVGSDLNGEPKAADKIGDPLAYKIFADSSLGLGSAYKDAAYTTWKRRPKGEVRRVIDYIFFSQTLLNLQTYLALPTKEEMPAERFPTFAYPSDHAALMAGFRFV